RSRTSLREVPGVGQEVGRGVGCDRAVVPPERHLRDLPLVEPLTTAAARRGGYADRGDLPRPHAGRGGIADRRLLGALAERVGRVLDVDAGELTTIRRAHDGADRVVRVGRVRVPSRGLRLLDQIAHENTWKTTSVASAPTSAP